MGKRSLDGGEVICKQQHDVTWEVKKFSVTGFHNETEQVLTNKVMLTGLQKVLKDLDLKLKPSSRFQLHSF